MTSNEELTQTYEAILAECREDLKVIGFILTGSRGKGFTTEYSDYDFTIVVADGMVDEYESKYANLPEGLDCHICMKEDFRTLHGWGGIEQFYRYTWAHLKPQIDRTGGDIQRIVIEKSLVPENHVDKFINDSLDHYANQFYRSLKCLRINDTVGHRLEAAEMVMPFFDAVFALHGRRLRPYYKYLEWELDNFPLNKLPWNKDTLLEMVFSILETGNFRSQQEIFGGIEKLFRNEGYDDIFDSWGTHLSEMLEWKPNDRVHINAKS